MAEFKEYIKNIITNQYAKVDDKIEKQLHPLSLQVKEVSSKQSKREKLLNESLEKMRNNKKISTKFEISRIETEECLKTKIYKYKSETYISTDMKLLTINHNKCTSSYDYRRSPQVFRVRWLFYVRRVVGRQLFQDRFQSLLCHTCMACEGSKWN